MSELTPLEKARIERDYARGERDQHWEALVEAEERIKALEAERNRYRKALEQMSRWFTRYTEGELAGVVIHGMRDIARHALNREDHDGEE